MSTPNDTAKHVEYVYPDGRILKVDACDADLLFANKWSLSGAELKYAVRALRKAEVEDYDYLKRQHIALHRLIGERIVGRPLADGEVIDHINHDTLDNRRTNLRVVGQSVNVRNQRPEKTARLRSSKLGDLKGAYLHPSNGRYRAILSYMGKCIYLGTYATAQEAHEVYCNAVKERFGSI